MIVESSSSATVSGELGTDVDLALNWLSLNGMIGKRQKIRRVKGKYVSSVNLKVSRKKVSDALSSRFGRFVKLT